MKKAILLILASTFVLSGLGASIFSGYDFTFFKSVSESIAAMDSEKVGFDYTGYGYLGDMTSGIFLRLGLQAPYSTLLASFDLKETEEDAGLLSMISPTDIGDDEDKQEFTFLFAFGPAFRRFVSPTLSWYMGLGIKVEQDITSIAGGKADGKAMKITVSSVSSDIDIGFRLTAEEHTTFRIGVYLTRPLFILTETKAGDGTDGSDFIFQQNIFTPRGSGIQWDIQGYISLGHTYASFMKTEKYRYTISSNMMFSGTLEPM